MRRRIHDAKNASALHFAAYNRRRVQESAIALMILTLARFAAQPNFAS